MVKEYSIRNDAIREQILKSTNVIAFEIFTFEIFDLEKQGQDQRVQYSKMLFDGNVEIYKCHILQFCTSFRRFRDIHS